MLTLLAMAMKSAALQQQVSYLLQTHVVTDAGAASAPRGL